MITKPLILFAAATLVTAASLRAGEPYEEFRRREALKEVEREHAQSLGVLFKEIEKSVAAPPLAQHYIAPPPPKVHVPSWYLYSYPAESDTKALESKISELESKVQHLEAELE